MEKDGKQAAAGWGYTETISKILDAALDVFGTKGFDATSMGDVAHSAGVSKQLIYHYFEGKHDLYAVVLAHVAQINYNALLTVNFAELAPAEALRKSFLALFDSFALHRSAANITIDQALHAGTLIKRDRRADDLRRQFFDQFGEVVERGKQAGDIAEDVDAISAHILATVLIIGRFSVWPMLLQYMKRDELPEHDRFRMKVADYYVRALRP